MGDLIQFPVRYTRLFEPASPTERFRENYDRVFGRAAEGSASVTPEPDCFIPFRPMGASIEIDKSLLLDSTLNAVYGARMVELITARNKAMDAMIWGAEPGSFIPWTPPSRVARVRSWFRALWSRARHSVCCDGCGRDPYDY